MAGSRKVLAGMAGECFGPGRRAVAFVGVVPVFSACDIANGPHGRQRATRKPKPVSDWLGTVNSYFGAGIYEELLFRMILLNLGMGLLAWLRAGRQASLMGGIVISSLLFSAAHYVGPSGDSFNWLTFCFRFLAGVFFAVLYLYRGFGIAAGTHALTTCSCKSLLRPLPSSQCDRRPKRLRIPAMV